MPLKVNLFPLKLGTNGTWCERTATVELDNRLTHEQMATTIVHEIIHASHRDFGDSLEWTTSTLTASLKPEVAELAKLLLEGTYSRAGKFAHAKMTYQKDADSPDDYNEAQYDILGLSDPYRRR